MTTLRQRFSYRHVTPQVRSCLFGARRSLAMDCLDSPGDIRCEAKPGKKLVRENYLKKRGALLIRLN